MSDQQTVEELISRLERERLYADRIYNDALTVVDHAIQTLPALPTAPTEYDPARLPDVNAAWNILPEGPPSIDRTWRGRLRGLVWRMIGPSLEAQHRFNAAVADHLNRNAGSHQEVTRAVTSLITAFRLHAEALIHFESVLVQYLQTITLYVDSKDRSLGGPELRERLALTEQRLLALKREVERREQLATSAEPVSTPRTLQEPFSGSVDSLTYVAFEDRFRGAQADIRTRVEDYLPLLTSVTDVVDIGCGRGELLGLLRERGVSARGVDVNPAMVEICRSLGFIAEQADALSFLERQPDASVGGLVAIQVVEHFEPAYLAKFLAAAFYKTKPGAPLILETINPACWMAYFETYLRDPTHRQPLHPDTLRHLVQASGFSQVDVQFRQPVRQLDRLNKVEGAENATSPQALAAAVAAINDHADKLNTRLFSSMDYVVVGRR